MTENLMLFTEEVKKEQVTPVKKEIKNDSDSEDEGKKDRQRFKSERPKEAQFKIEKHEQSMWNLYQKWFLFFLNIVELPFRSTLGSKNEGNIQ